MRPPPTQHLSWLSAGLPVVLLAAACGSDSKPPPLGADDTAATGSNTSSGGSMASGGEGGESTGTTVTSAGGTAQVTSTQGAGGGAGQQGSTNASGGVGGGNAVCGDGVADADPCDGDDLNGATCADVGFETGELSCSADCQLLLDACSGTERCSDGRDNDGDGAVDCDDSACSDQCQDACLEPIEIAAGETVEGSTFGRAASLTSSCAGASGPEIVYQVVAEVTGKLDAELESAGDLTVSFRTACDDDGSERACRVVDVLTRASADAVQGETLYVVVDGWDSDSEADFTLRVDSRLANQCGDSVVDDAEQCDDDNLIDGDGCDGSCQVESNEAEPNDSLVTAAPPSDPLYAMIDPVGDVDYYLLQVSDGPRTVTIDTHNLGAGYCSDLLMDPALELIAAAGEVVVASDDDSGDGYCARIVATLDSGDYYIVVRESADAGEGVLPTFPYQLGVVIE